MRPRMRTAAQLLDMMGGGAGAARELAGDPTRKAELLADGISPETGDALTQQEVLKIEAANKKRVQRAAKAARAARAARAQAPKTETSDS